MLSKKEIEAAFLHKLAGSKLGPEDAKASGYACYSSEEVAAKKTFKNLTAHPAGGFTLPYYDPAGQYLDFFRFRYLEEPPRNGFAALTQKKAPRYVQPAGAAPRLYFSPLYPWAEYFKKPAAERWLVITEGELKAACACKLGYPVVALGGVWNFMSKRGGVDLIPDLADLPLAGTPVYIAYDSDTATNPDVMKAMNTLARRLLQLTEARPFIVRIPPLKDLPKAGLDDYIVAKGKTGFENLIKKAEEWEPSAALHELNEEVLFLREGANVMELSTRHRWRASDFINSVYANRTYSAKEVRKKETVLVEKRTAAEWIKWRGRAEVERMTYIPGAPTVVDSEYNAWRGWGVAEELIKRGDVTPWNELLDFLFRGHLPEHRKWFEQWIAYPLQFPGTKLFQAALLWGPPGTGKTLVGHTMGRIYGSNYTEVNERELHASFNEWAECKQFALGDEITGGDKRAVADYLKGIVTQKYLRINPKHIKPYTVPDCINWLFTSNHCDAFFVEDDDRRYFISEVKNKARDRDFYRAYDKWYRSPEGIGALFHYLLRLDLTGFDPMDPAPVTSSKKEMISDVRSEVASWCAALRENPDEVLRLDGGQPIMRHLWTTGELFAVHRARYGDTRLTENGLGRELKRAGFRKALDGAPLRSPRQGLVKLWVIRTEGLKDTQQPKYYADLYDRELGAMSLEKEKKY